MPKEINTTYSVKIFHGTGTAQGKFVVIATDLTPQTAVANHVEQIAADVCQKMKLDISRLIFIEHRRATQKFEETFDLVELKWKKRENSFCNPQWSPISKEKVEAITGE